MGDHQIPLSPVAYRVGIPQLGWSLLGHSVVLKHLAPRRGLQ